MTEMAIERAKKEKREKSEVALEKKRDLLYNKFIKY
jgi:hypothetical protein